LSDQIKQQDKQDLWTTSRKMTKILPIFFLMAIICNQARSSTGNMIRSPSVIPTRGSIVKPASRDTSEFGWQTRIKLSRSDQSQRIQLASLGQTVQQQPTPITLSHILGEVVNSLWIVVPLEIMIVIPASATKCRYARGLAVLIITPGLSPHGVQDLRTNDTEALSLTNGCTGITTSPQMKLFSMGSPPLCTKANLWRNTYDPNSPTGQFQSLIERTTNPFPYSAISALPISLRIIATIMFFTVTSSCVILPIKSGPFVGLATDQPATVGAPPMLMIGQDDASTQIRDIRARPAVLEAVSG
jgi:hypothetical protein